MTLLLKEHDLWKITEKVAPTPIDAAEKAALVKKDIKAQRVIMDVMKDHLIPHVAEKQSAREMFKALVDLFQSDNLNGNMVSRNKLKSIQMSRSNNVTSYFMRITQTRDQLAAIGEKVDEEKLVYVALNGFTKSWEPFVKGICAREKLPNWQRLWDDRIQEETREEPKERKQEDGENLALVDQTKRSKGQGSKEGGKKDLRRVKCFACHMMGHYASQCPEKTQQVATSANAQVMEFVEKFKKDFLLVSCLSGTVSNDAWYLDSGASHHMTKAWELFSSLTMK